MTIRHIAKFQVLATDNTEALDVCVQESTYDDGMLVRSEFIVFINGGICSTGVEEAHFTELKPALQFAAEEARIALEGGN
jgi:hypothetical protein